MKPDARKLLMISSALMVAGHISEEAYAALRAAADRIEKLEAALLLADEVVATAKQVLENGGGTTNGVSRPYNADWWVAGNASLLELIPAYLAARTPSPEHEAADAILSDHHATRTGG